MLKKILLMVLLTTTMFSPIAKASTVPEPAVSAGYAVAIDAVTGEVLYDKNANSPAMPASMTKVLTAIILDEKVKDNEKIAATPDAMATPCECYGFKQGEEISKQDALHAMMIKSANDVAVAVAEHISGSIPDFAKLMNEMAKKIGVSSQTNFVTPNGLTDPNHRVTPYDMALIMRDAINHPDILNAITSKNYTVKSNKQEQFIPRHDTIARMQNVVGGKTGYTDAAGNTLTAYFKEGDKQVITVVMKGRPSIYYKDTQAIANYALNQLDEKQIVSKGTAVTTKTINGKQVKLLAANDFNVTFKKGEDVNLSQNVVLDKNMDNESINKGEKLGVLEVYKEGKLLKKIDLVSDRKVIMDKPKVTVSKYPTIIIAILIPLAIYIGYLVWYNQRKRKSV